MMALRDAADRTPMVPGHEVSGRVVQTGPGATLTNGQRVCGLVPFDLDGAAAEFVAPGGRRRSRRLARHQVRRGRRHRRRIEPSIVALAAAFPHWKPVSIVFATATLASLWALQRWWRTIPATVVVLAAAWTVTRLGRLDDHGVATVGRVAAIVPSWSIPDLARAQWMHLTASAFGLPLICFVLSFAVANRVTTPAEGTLDANREMVAVGVANMLAGLVGGLASAGCPEASPAVRGFVSPAPFLRSWHRDRPGLAVSLCAAAGVVILGLLAGLLLAVLLSLVLFVGLFFANVDLLVTQVMVASRRQPTPDVVVLDLSASLALDLASIDALGRLRTQLHGDGVALRFVHLYLGAADAVAASTLAEVTVYPSATAAAVQDPGARA